jgi:hypothetical protein
MRSAAHVPTVSLPLPQRLLSYAQADRTLGGNLYSGCELEVLLKKIGNE